MTTKAAMRPYRTTARVVGVMYLAGFVVGIVGIMLIQSVLGAPNYLSTVSANSMTLAFAAILWLMAVVGYLAARIVDAVFIAIMVLFVLLQIPLGSAYLNAAAADAPALYALSALLSQAQLYAYEIGMIALGLSGLLLCSTLYRAQLLPRWLAAWGLVGYALISVGMLSAIMGSGLGDLSSYPGGLWEAFVGVWLIVKGFNTPASVPETPKTGTLAAPLVP
jgi:hypothetical protein